MDLGLAKNTKPNPRENASILSIATLSYTLPTFIECFKKEIEVSDLHKTYSNHKSKILGDKLEQAWEKEILMAAKSKRQPSLKRALLKTFGCEFMLLGLLSFAVELFVKMSQPLLLGQLISYYTPQQNTVTMAEAYVFAGGIVGCAFAIVLTVSPYNLAVSHIGMKIRIACSSLIYRKALRLSKTSVEETTVGQMVNLLSNDVQRFNVVTLNGHYLWIAPLQAIVGTYFMYQEVGISAVIGVSVLLLYVPLQFGLAKMIAKFRQKTARETDERVRLMNEVLSGIQIIKMYTWEKPFAKLVSLVRRSEIKYIRGVLYIRAIIICLFLFSTKACVFVSILSYVLFGFELTAKKVFVLTAFYNIINESIAHFFPQSITRIAEANVSVNRLTKFMLHKEKPPTPIKTTLVPENPIYSVSIENGYTERNQSSTNGTLQRLNIKIKRGSVVAIIGPVGSGKSSVLQILLNELPLSHGTLEMHGGVSYAAQEPWLFTGTIRQNIIFNKPYDAHRYKLVVNKCRLIRDLNLFPRADKTVVGERGVSLSGGQRARINLARAIYQQADIYLLDDPLSAVDAHVGRELFDKCIMGYLKGKTVILVTHQLQFLKDVDQIIILEGAMVKAQGTFEELQRSGLDFANLLKNELVKEKVQEPLKQFSGKVSVVSLPTFDELDVNSTNKNEEYTAKGNVSNAIYTTYFTVATNWKVVLVILVLFILSQTVYHFGDVFLSRWINVEEARNSNGSTETTGSMWAFSTNISIYIYTGITIATVLLMLTRSISFLYICMKSSEKLHDNMFNSITNATMRFFNTNSSGRILNRFSKDMGAIDEILPTAMADCSQILLTNVGIAIVIATVNPWLLLPTVVITLMFMLLSIIYLRTSRNVKRLEGVTKSPVFGHLNASLQGLTTIRAFGSESTLISEFDELQDLHSVPSFLFISTARGFAYWLDIVCAIYTAVVTFSFLVFDDDNFASNVGLAITQSLHLVGSFQWGVRQMTEVENQMTSVERVLEYNQIEHERLLQSHPDRKPPPSWPREGEINFDKVYLYYFPEDPPVLKNLSFTIKPLEKIGIVGRTGAGKSSLINAIFQLTDTHGTITIDDINIKDIGLHDLRTKISIIPQEPVLFSGTIRKNLDPFDEYSDDALWKSLNAVELRDVFKKLNLDLNSGVSEGGSNFSVGQRQLICLARAILRNNKILILDEATANVDHQTDALIQTTIRKEFVDCTVLTIAHRLNTVMDSDKVLVMEAGAMVEFDHPFQLLQNTSGHLHGMVQQTGMSMVEILTNMAKESLEKLQNKKKTV